MFFGAVVGHVDVFRSGDVSGKVSDVGLLTGEIGVDDFAVHNCNWQGAERTHAYARVRRDSLEDLVSVKRWGG